MKSSLFLLIIVILLFSAVGTGAQGGPSIQELNGFVSVENEYVYFDLFGMQAGTTIYLYAESDEFDTWIGICDITCEKVIEDNDDISENNLNSALSYTFAANGDYSIFVTDCCRSDVQGAFRLLIGINAPDVLTGDVLPTGALIAQEFQPVQTTPGGGAPSIQEFYSVVSVENEYVYFDLFGMRAGTTIYLYAESDDIDTLLGICDIDCDEQFVNNDDISENDLNSALSYTFEADGDYSIFVTDCCSSDVKGVFRLLIGFNAPNVLDGSAFPNGGQIAIPYEPTYTEINIQSAAGGAQVQQFYGHVSPEAEYIYYDIYGAQAGQTLYLYAGSSEIDPRLIVCDIECEEIFADVDDIADDNFNAAVEYTFPANGDYSVAVTDCCSSDVEGDFRLLLGYNAPQVLTGDAVPTGAEIAEEYEPNRVTAGDAERTDRVDCADAELTLRPVLSGPELTTGTDNFLVHYTLEGEDATTNEFVNEVIAFLESNLEIQTGGYGWPSPPRDCGEGGDDRFDFYLEEIFRDNILGYAEPGNVVGDNPNSSYSETWAAYSYMTIDNDFHGADAPLAVMRATVAHEFHHSIQFGYDISDATSWYYEATASWMETQASPQDEDATGYTDSVFYSPDLCIGTENEETGTRIYGEWLLIDSITQDYGADAVIRLWEYIADYEGMEAFYRFLDSLGTTPQEVVKRYAIRNLLRGYTFGPVFQETVFVENVINGPGIVTPTISGVQELSVDYLLVRQRGVYNFSINQSNLSVIVVGINRKSNEAHIFDLGQGGTVDTGAFSNAYVMILNNTQHDDPANCSTTNWELSVSDGSGKALAVATGNYDASNFVPAG